jgi:hypothetical protein
MERKPCRRHSHWMITTMVLGLTLLWSFGGPWIASADDPGAICVLRISSQSSKVLSVLVNEPQNFNVAVPTPISKNVNVPIQCDGLETLAVAVANQNADTEQVTVRVFTHDGTLFCSKGPFILPPHGSQGVIFSDCQ